MASGVIKVTAFTHVEGPIFDGRAEDALKEYDRDVRKAIADRGVELLRAFPMNKTGRAHGAFQAALHTVERDLGTAIPGPQFQGIAWAPWLEGTTKRNRSTKFKGYHLFKKVSEQIQDEAADIGERELQKYLPKLGGD